MKKKTKDDNKWMVWIILGAIALIVLITLFSGNREEETPLADEPEIVQELIEPIPVDVSRNFLNLYTEYRKSINSGRLPGFKAYISGTMFSGLETGFGKEITSENFNEFIIDYSKNLPEFDNVVVIEESISSDSAIWIAKDKANLDITGKIEFKKETNGWKVSSEVW